MEVNAQKSLIYGCMGLGGGWSRDPITSDDERVAQLAVDAALENGITTFDHADIYAFGKSETVFGTVLKSNPGLREKIRIQSKAGIRLKTGPDNSNTYDFSRPYLEKQISGSLKRLNTEYLDLFLLHRPDPLMNPEELAEIFLFLKQRGWVKSFGVSNMSVRQIQVLNNYCGEEMVANQLQFGLAHTLILEEGVFVNNKRIPTGMDMGGMLPYAQAHRMEIQAWRPLDRGKYVQAEEPSDDKACRDTKLLVQSLAHKYNTDASAVLLAWVLKLPCRISAIIGTTKPARIKSAADSLKIELSREDWYDLWLTANHLVLP
ncbi:MAG: aldo/keto reductase [Bacteroidota bacterium]